MLSQKRIFKCQNSTKSLTCGLNSSWNSEHAQKPHECGKIMPHVSDMWFLTDKKAGEKVLSIWWFFILALIGVSVVASVVMYYSADVDVKEIESNILADRVADCIIQNGYLNNEFMKAGSSFNVFKNCNIDESVIKSNNDFYIGISAYNFASCNEKGECTGEIKRLSFSAGAGTIPEDCNIKLAEEKKKGKAEHFPRCSEKSFVALNRHDKAIPEKLILKILAGSNQKGRIEL